MMNRKIKIVAAVTFINVALYTAPCHAFLWPTFDIAEVLNTISGYMTKAKSTASTVKSTMSVGKIQQAIGDNVGSLSKFVDVKEKAEKQQKKLEKQKRRAERLAKLRKKWEDAQKMIDKIKNPYSQLRNYTDEYYSDGKELFEQGQKYYQEGQKQYDSAKKDYENAKKEYESLKQQYEKATDAERAGIQGKYVEAMQKYNEAKDKFDDISLSYTPETVSAEEDFSDEDFGLEDEDFGFDEIEEEIPEPTAGVAENNGGLARNDGGLARNEESAQSSGSNVSSVFEESPAVKVAPSFDGDDGSDIIVKDNPRQFKRAVAPLNKAEKVSAVFTSASRPQAFAQLGKNVLAEKNKEFKSGTNADGKFIYSDEIATKCDMEVEDLTAEKVSECVKSWVLDLHDPNAEIAAEWQRLYKRAKHDHVANDLAVALTHKNYSANFGKVNEDLEKKSEALTNEREEVSFSGTVALTNQEIIIRLMEAMTGQITTEAVNSIGMLERDYYDDEDKDDGNE